MLRFVADPGHDTRLLWDPRERAPGRGVRVCADRTCLSKRKLWRPELRAALEAWVLDQLGLYQRQHRVSVGAEAAITAVEKGEAALCLVASDVAERTRKHVSDAVSRMNAGRGPAADWLRSMKALAGQNARDDAEGEPVRPSAGTEIALVFLPCTMQGLGRALGRDTLGVVALAKNAGATMKNGSLLTRAALLGSNGERQNG